MSGFSELGRNLNRKKRKNPRPERAGRGFSKLRTDPIGLANQPYLIVETENRSVIISGFAMG